MQFLFLGVGAGKGKEQTESEAGVRTLALLASWGKFLVVGAAVLFTVRWLAASLVSSPLDASSTPSLS